jgi:hypothetical protein
MKSAFTAALAAFAAAAMFSGAAAAAPPTPVIDDPRPRDSTANLPSATGSQTTLPGGAVTGAGQPQGRTIQPEVGAPGGLQPRARSEAMEAEKGEGATGDGARRHIVPQAAQAAGEQTAR